MTETVSFGYEDVDPQEKTRRVGGVFTNVARRYDLMNDAMSGGMHRLWKDRFVRRVKPRAGEDVLDMAGGTGDIAFRLAKAGANVTVADINPAMLEVGMERARKKGLTGSCGRSRMRRRSASPTAASTPTRSRSASAT
jgi:demethylmenaquinone methyltransferase/2-methoxy-6-polyprenyl-1,4-benzoquinol methylase